MLLRRRSFLQAALPAAALTFPRAGAAQAPPVIRIATSAAETYAQAFYAQDLGLYQKAGLNVEVQVLGTGAAVSTAVAGGAVDVGVATTINLANAITRGVPFVMIAPSGMTTPKNPTGLMCVAKTSAFHTAKDLDGKTICVPALKQTADLAVRVWLTKGGADLTKTHIIEGPFAEMGPSLERGTYEGATISEPALSVALAKGNVRVIGDPFGSIAPEYMFAGWFTTIPFMQKNPDAVRRIAAALTEAGKWANAHHFESAAIVSRVNKVDVEIIRAEVRPIYAEEIKLAEIQPQLDAGLKFGFLTRAVNAAELLPASATR